MKTNLSDIAKRVNIIAESSEMKDIISVFSDEYDIYAAMDDLVSKLVFKDTKGELIDSDDGDVEVYDDGISLTVVYQAQGYVVPGEATSKWSPGNEAYFEEVEHIFDIDYLNKQLLRAGLYAKWRVSDEFIYGSQMINGKFQRVKNDYEDTFILYASHNFADESVGLRKRTGRDEFGPVYDPNVPINVDMVFDIELADFAAFGKFLLPFKKDVSDMKENEVLVKEAGPRKPRVTSADLAATMPHSKIPVPKTTDAHAGAWKDAEDMAAKVGYDKVWQVTVTGQGEWGNWEYGGTWYSKFPIFFYAFDKEDALDRLNVFKDKKFAGNKDSYKNTDPVEIDSLAAQKVINIYNTYASEAEKMNKDLNIKVNAEHDYKKRNHIYEEHAKALRALSDKFREDVKPYEYQNGEYYAPYNEQFCTHILAIPTKKMLELMVKSADWAVALVQKMHDLDEAKLKEEWLKTPDGKKWQRKFDEEKLAATRRAERAAEKQKAAEEAEVLSEEIAKCLSGKSTDYAQYNSLGVVPVEVSGGKKFRGKGFVYSIESVESNYGYNSYDNYTDLAKIFIPSNTTNEFATANLKYCKIDTSVSPADCKKTFDMWCLAKVNSTLEWCRSKQPGKSESEILSWAANIVKKHAPMIDILTYFPSLNVANAEDDRVKSTVQWAISLGYPQDKTNFIIKRALEKKRIKPVDYKNTINNLLLIKFGKSNFQF